MGRGIVAYLQRMGAQGHKRLKLTSETSGQNSHIAVSPISLLTSLTSQAHRTSLSIALKTQLSDDDDDVHFVIACVLLFFFLTT